MDRKRMEALTDRIAGQLRQLENNRKDGCKYDIVSMEQWEWPQGVALFALYLYYGITADGTLLEYLTDWFHRQMRKGLPEVNVNTTAPMLTMACLYESTGDEIYRGCLEHWCTEVMCHIPRTEEGGIQHTTSDVTNDGQLWDDTLYMAVLFLARWGMITGNETLIRETVRQFLVHVKYLLDRKTGLFYHGWSFRRRDHFAGALWARGNSWYTAGLTDYLAMTEINKDVRDYLETVLEGQVRALQKCQDKSGLWHTLLNDADSYLETSASSAFAYGILKAVRTGILDKKYEETGMRAAEGVLGQISDDGIVHGVSWGTPVFDTLEEYRQVERRIMPYGQSMALLMLTEILRR